MPSLAELVVNLTANTAAFTAKMDAAAKDAQRFGKSMESTLSGLKSLGAALGVAFSVEQVVEFGKKSLEAMDHINKLSQSTGVSVETLSAMSYQAKLAGVDIDALGKGLEIFSKKIYAAYKGGADSFNGIKIADKGQLRETSDIFADMSTKVASLKDGVGKTGLVMESFGKTGAALIPMLNQGGEKAKIYADEAKRMGYAFSKDAAQGAEDLHDNLERMDMMFTGLANRVISQMVPALMAYSEEMTKVGQNNALITLADDISDSITRGMIAVDFAATRIRMLGIQIRDYAELSGVLRAAAQGNPGAAAALYLQNRKDRATEYDDTWNSFEKRSVSAMFPKPLTASNPTGTGTVPPSGGTGAGKDLTAQMESARAAIQGILEKIAEANGNAIEKLNLEWDGHVKKLQDIFAKFPQLAQQYPGMILLANAARIHAANAEFEKELEASNKAIAEVLKENKDFPKLVPMPTAKPVLNAATPWELEMIKLQTKLGEMDTLGQQVWGDTRTAAERYAFELQKLNLLLADGKVNQDTYNRAVHDLKSKLDENTIAVNEFGRSMGDALNQAAFSSRGWSAAIGDIILQLGKLIVKMTLAKSLSNMGGGWFSQLMSGFLGVAIPAASGGGGVPWQGPSASVPLFGGSHDFAGPASAGVSYKIGTEEYFTPKMNGYITPTKGIKGGGGPVYNIDARGADAGVEARIYRAIAQSKAEAVATAVATTEERRRRS